MEDDDDGIDILSLLLGAMIGATVFFAINLAFDTDTTNQALFDKAIECAKEGGHLVVSAWPEPGKPICIKEPAI